MPRIDKATRYSYVLDWIDESERWRRAQNQYVDRAVMAYQGLPSINRYSKTFRAYADSIYKEDPERGKELRKYCDDLPDKKNFAVHNAIETIVSMTMGGVGRYEFGPYDPEMQKNDKVIDMLSAAAKHFYDTNKMDAVVPQYIRDACMRGASYMHIKQKNKKIIATILDSDQVYTDPKRFKTSQERFRGFSQRESFKSIKDRVKKERGGAVLKTLNEADVYVSQIVKELNDVYTFDATKTFLNDELSQDLDIFYKPLLARIQEVRKDNPDYMYTGDEVEISYMYDFLDDMYFEIVNRRYIIVAKKNPLKRTITCKIPYFDDEGKYKKKEVKKTIKINDPIIELPYLKTSWDSYPVTPLFYLLDDFDDLCAMESVNYHNLSIMAPITFIGQSSDAEKVSRMLSVSGEVVEGLPQTFGTLAKTHDVSAVQVAIQQTEDKIKRVMKATDPFELQGMIGDRATAKETGLMAGQVSQGLNPFIANVEAAMSELGDKCLKLYLILNDEDYSFTYNGKYGELSPQEMAGEYQVRAKLQSAIKFEQEANARKALELIQYLSGLEAVDKQQFLGTMIPIVLGTLVNREEAKAMVTKEYQPMPTELIEQIKIRTKEEVIRQMQEEIKAQDQARKEEERRANNPNQDIDDLDFSGATPEEMQALIEQADQVAMSADATFEGTPPMPGQFPDEAVGAGIAQTQQQAPVQESLSVIQSQGDLIPQEDPLAGLNGLPSNPEAGEIANSPERNLF